MNPNAQIVEAIIPSFRGKAILLGLLSKKLESTTYHESEVNEKKWVVKKRILPNGFARMDILLINDEVAGTIVCCEISKNVYHMVGMFIDERFRSQSSKYAKSGAISKSPEGKPTSVATFFLEAFLQDVLINNIQVSLEVLDHNKPAWHLYEKKLFFDSQLDRKIGFRLMNKEEILCYSNARNKKIGKWHSVTNTDGAKGEAVQWSHVPDFDGTSRWSINRLYLINSGDASFSIKGNQKYSLQSKLGMLYTILRYGEAIPYVIEKLR